MIRRRLARASRREMGGDSLGDGPYGIGLIYCAYCNYIRPRARSSSASAGVTGARFASPSATIRCSRLRKSASDSTGGRGRHGNERDHEHLERAIPAELRGRRGVVEDHGLVRQVSPEHGHAAARPRLEADKVRVVQVGGNAGRASVAHDHDAPVHASRMRQPYDISPSPRRAESAVRHDRLQPGPANRGAAGYHPKGESRASHHCIM